MKCKRAAGRSEGMKCTHRCGVAKREGMRGDRPNNHNLSDWLENTEQITHK